MLPDAASLYVMGVDDRQHVNDKKAFWQTRQLVGGLARGGGRCPRLGMK
jgi:hypothetical protein